MLTKFPEFGESLLSAMNRQSPTTASGAAPPTPHPFDGRFVWVTLLSVTAFRRQRLSTETHAVDPAPQCPPADLQPGPPSRDLGRVRALVSAVLKFMGFRSGAAPEHEGPGPPPAPGLELGASDGGPGAHGARASTGLEFSVDVPGALTEDSYKVPSSDSDGSASK